MKRIIVGVLVALFVTGCRSNPNQNNKEATNMTYNNYGHEVIIAEIPQKIVTLGPNCTELMIALGLENLIIGNTLNNHSRGALEEYKEAYEAIPEINYGSATREAVVTSGADFIYGIDWEFGDSGLDINELNQFGITVYMNSATTFEEIYQEIEDLGKIFDVEDKATEFINNQESRIEAIEVSIKNKEPIKVLVYDSGNDGVFTASGSNFESLLIEKAGGINIFNDITNKQWITVSYEEIIQRNPDVIIIHDYDSPSVEEKINQIKANPALSTLDCVKNNKFVVISLESVLPGSRMAYSVETFYNGFYE